MELLKFRVLNFRSIDDSGWIETENVTALIGTNESGKTNLLCALWKLNPASKDGDINLLSDAPRKLYSEYRASNKQQVFIKSSFRLSEQEAAHVANLRKCSAEEVKNCSVERRYDGFYYITFPNQKQKNISSSEAVTELNTILDFVKSAPLLKSENEEKRDIFTNTIESILNIFSSDRLSKQNIEEAISLLNKINSDDAPKTSSLTKAFSDIDIFLKNSLKMAEEASEEDQKKSRNYIVSKIPKFVYYSNYGNLDSEIYLPHVIENMSRTDLGTKESAKVKTLKVLFDFVGLKPEEIRELGGVNVNEEISSEEIESIAGLKKERSVLLQSASTLLTNKFKNWWKQGEYRFRFEADGDHFRIWVSDDKRPEDIELEGRSTGLQWFLSFYLTFLVESKDSHDGAILLLDEPGLSLHPLAQKDLSLFFDNLSITNKIVYTTHSPFLVDPNHLDRVKAVYIQENGTTNVSANLRASESDPSQTKSIYPVHAALGLSVSEMLFNNCAPVLVEGPSDQIYLSAIKTLLISLGEFQPKKDILFIPTGGARGVKPIVSLLTGKNEKLPVVLLDSDEQGTKAADSLRKEIYLNDKDLVLNVSDFIDMENAEVEDLIPSNVILKAASYFLRPKDPDIDFEETYQVGKPILTQIEKFAEENEIALEKGWKVELAKTIKTRLLKLTKNNLEKNTITSWKKLFEKFNISP